MYGRAIVSQPSWGLKVEVGEYDALGIWIAGVKRGTYMSFAHFESPSSAWGDDSGPM